LELSVGVRLAILRHLFDVLRQIWLATGTQQVKQQRQGFT
jgi:hypothetical protein